MINQNKTTRSDLLKQIKSEDESASFPAISQSGQNSPDNPEKPTPPEGGGPQFGLKGSGGWGEKVRGWINKYGSSVILPIIALLILAGGIYLYASQKSQPETGLPSEKELAANLGESAPISQEEKTILPEEESDQPDDQDESSSKEIEEIIPAGRSEKGTIIEKAAAGDGVTHLARRALKDYLQNEPKELSKEHKIYIEDYLKDEIGSQPLEVDQEIAFSEDLIEEAINASQDLSPEQLKALEEYSALVVSW